MYYSRPPCQLPKTSVRVTYRPIGSFQYECPKVEDYRRLGTCIPHTGIERSFFQYCYWAIRATFSVSILFLSPNSSRERRAGQPVVPKTVNPVSLGDDLAKGIIHPVRYDAQSCKKPRNPFHNG